MQNLIQIAVLITPLFSLMAIGYLSGKIAKFEYGGLAWLNFFVIYIALPAMFFKLLSQTPLSGIVGLRLVAITTFTTLIIFCICFFVAAALRVLKKGEADVGEAAIQGFAGAYGNVGYMGPPLAIAAFGPIAITPAALIFSFDNALHFTLAPLLMGLRNQGEGKIQFGRMIAQIIWKIISHPFILATLAGFTAAAFEFYPPNPAARIIDLLAGAAAPCALFMMGVSAALKPLKRIPLELGYLVPIKLIIHPLAVYGLMTLVGGFPTIFIQTAVLLAALPAAANVFILAEQYQTWQERASSAVVVSTVISIFTLSAVLFFLKTNF